MLLRSVSVYGSLTSAYYLCVPSSQVRGVTNTPGAINAKVQGKFWDDGRREWTSEDPSKAILLEALNEDVRLLRMAVVDP